MNKAQFHRVAMDFISVLVCRKQRSVKPDQAFREINSKTSCTGITANFF